MNRGMTERLVTLLGVMWCVTGAAAPPRPNILFIFSDDHAQHAISAYGSRVNTTPHLDRLAAEGARFTNSFVTNSICTPSRATLLTGQYSHRNGVPVFNRFDGSRDHVAKRLQQAGYHTGMIGKWHLGSDPTGFDRWIVLPGQGVYHDPAFLVPGGGRLTIEGHATDITGDLGVEFLRTRPAEKPFFLMLHHKAPHREWAPDERNKARFRDAVIPEPETLHDDYATRPAALPENEQTVARDLTRRDLKLEPPRGLEGKARQAWLGAKPDTVEVDGRVLTGSELAPRPANSWPTSTSPPRSSTWPASPSRRRCRAGASCRCFAARRRPTGGRASTTATTTTPATMTRGPTTGSAPPRTS